MRFEAVLDRYEGDKGILIFEDDEEVWVISKKKLPDGLKEGDMVRIDINFDAFATLFRRQEVQKKMQRLIYPDE